MAEASKNSMVISRKHSGFPDYLDFDRLRREGIDYLGKLGGKIWTDHNVHDPGITILEMLCYALLDLGYRTNLPEEDIFSRDPADQTADNNFFTAAQILACNPVTITDYRKMLIDIEGVKNAWLEIATDQKDFCRPNREKKSQDRHGASRADDEGCVEFLNGLYHVCIDLERNLEKDFPNEAEKSAYLASLEKKIRHALMSHRNLCEDFIDIYFLCKEEIGVCADILLEDEADPESVYISMVEKLRQFFSPSPQYYTLQQLLDKQTPMDEIFAGRPYNITESHGFVDTVELEQLELKREIHLSDLYNVLLSVDGIRSVRQLSLNVCRNGNMVKEGGWKYAITRNHVPDFSVACSGFRFSRNDMPVFVDFQKFEGLFSINFAHNGKVLYRAPSPYLDSEIPKGVYLADLGDYYSVQNEFPRVYGIARGGLPENASAKRKAQAYQLKSWLLFFDQLLANYLSQLQHIRTLFSLSAPSGKKDRHTYFVNQLSTVPDLEKLLRFRTSDDQVNALGSEGSVLVFPVKREELLTMKQNGELPNLDPGGLTAVAFNTKAELDTAVSQIRNDLFFGQYECAYVTRVDDSVYYYMLTASEDLALVSKKIFRDQKEAAESVSSVEYIGTFDENYRSFTTTKGFSFNMELNLGSYARYLQLIAEDKDLFLRRRKQFQDHLLARFAEQFTAFAQLSFGFYQERQLKEKEIERREYYLGHYDELSSNRGRAYDYLENGWNSHNLSGFEMKVRAIGGMEGALRKSLCNFEVYQYDAQYAVNLTIAGNSYFKDSRGFETGKEAQAAAGAIFHAMRDMGNYSTAFVPHETAYELRIAYGDGRRALYPGQFRTSAEAMEVADSLAGLFREEDPAGSVFESAYQYIPVLQDAGGSTIRRSIDVYATEADARSGALKSIRKVDDRKKWDYDEKLAAIGHLYHLPGIADRLVYINTDAFKIDISNSIIGKPDKFSYELLDRDNTFKFRSALEFDSASQARAHAYDLLCLMTDRQHYSTLQGVRDQQYPVRIVQGDDVQATLSMNLASGDEAARQVERIVDIALGHLYTVGIEKKPYRWKFGYNLGVDRRSRLSFHSMEDYVATEEAAKAAAAFYGAIPSMKVKEKDGKYLLGPASGKKSGSIMVLDEGSISREPSELKSAVSSLLESAQELKRLSADPRPEAFRSSVDMDEVSKQGLFVYRLVDKDRIPAFYREHFYDRKAAEKGLKDVVRQSKGNADFLRICMGGDVISEQRQPGSQVKWYRYQVKSRNHVDASGESLVLFESVQQYPDQKSAEADFAKYHLDILSWASVRSNYGSRIILGDVPWQGDADPVSGESMVFVPASTLKSLDPDPAIALDRLISIALSFPVRVVVPGTREFKSLYPCAEVETDKDSCRDKNRKPVYYFTYPTASMEKPSWQSTRYFDTPDKAWAEFEFFLVLLKYPGNYFVDCDRCAEKESIYRIYIREVLAESARRFGSMEAAWGKEGVQRFICVSQSGKSFHTYADKEGCCHSFYVSCENGLVFHPCTYDTPAKRDAVMDKLYRGVKDWYGRKSLLPDTSGGAVWLNNAEGKPFAVLSRAEKEGRCVSDWIADISSWISGGEFHEERGVFVLNVPGEGTVLRSGEGVQSLEAWKEMLRDFTCYYPVVRARDEKTGRDRYCIEIKLPGFDFCRDEHKPDEPCGCGEKKEEDRSDCHIAWKGRCCYDTCADAERALAIILQLLQNYRNYQPVFDCDCGPFGIDIRYSRIGGYGDEQPGLRSKQEPFAGLAGTELVAINPQCYPYAEEACAATGRARQLINSEGLHLVEHILLRPRCNPDDCRCRQYTKRCDDETDCRFVWKADDEDPCSEEKDICFIPGQDPYSFIATVAMPAWPERFRKPENRKLVERILYQEAPAHVLLRILWLSPHDFCCFERQYKSWHRWLATKKTCMDGFSTCDFMEFLFDRNYECLGECDDCGPCDDGVDRREPCFPAETTGKEGDGYLSQVNDLFCWREQHCEKYVFVDCDRQVRQDQDEVILLRTAAKKKSQVVNARMNRYRKTVSGVLEKTNRHPLAEKVMLFLSDTHPSFERLSGLAEEVVRNKVPKGGEAKALTKAQARDLLEAGISYYIDKIMFNGREPARILEVKKVIDTLGKAKMSVGHLYEYFDVAELVAHEPSLEEETLTGIFGDR